MTSPQQPDVPPQGVPSGSPPQPGVHPTGQPPSQPGPPSQQPGVTPPKRKSNVSTGQILAGILLVVVVVFVLENTRKVKVRLLIPEVTAPLAVPIVIAAVLGALVAWFMRVRRGRRRKQSAAPPP